MSNYVNIINNSTNVLSIQLVPKNQASTIRFKNKPPLNYTTDENGAVSFSLATTKVDRSCWVVSENKDIIVTKVNGIDIVPAYLAGNGDQTEELSWFNDHALAQLGIGAVFLNTFFTINSETNQRFSKCFYNISPSQTVVLEGHTLGANNVPATITKHKGNAYFGDGDLNGDSLIQDTIGNWGMALGVSDNTKGTQLYWNPPILDNANTMLEGELYLALTLTSPGLDDVPMSHTATVTRENTEVTWSDAIDWNLVANEFINAFNTQHAAVTESVIPLFAKKSDTDHGALYLFELSAEFFESQSAFLPSPMYDNADGSISQPPIIEEPMMAMRSAAVNQTVELPPVPPSPYMGFPLVNILIAGTPLISPSMMEASKNEEYLETPDTASDILVIPELYNIVDTTLIVHIAVPETVTKPLITLAYDGYDSPLGKYGADLVDFRISSVGALKVSLHDRYGRLPEPEILA